MPEHMRRNQTVQARFDCGLRDRLLDPIGQQVIAHGLPGARVGAMAGGGEDPEPLPGARGARIFFTQLVRQGHSDGREMVAIRFPDAPRRLALGLQRGDTAGGLACPPSFSASDKYYRAALEPR